MDPKLVSLIIFTTMLIQHLESKIKDIPVSFKREQTIQLDEQKHNNFVHPDKIIKLTNIQETLKRIKRTSTILQKKDPQTPIDPLQIIHPIIKPEYGMLFEHQGYLMQGL